MHARSRAFVLKDRNAGRRSMANSSNAESIILFIIQEPFPAVKARIGKSAGQDAGSIRASFRGSPKKAGCLLPKAHGVNKMQRKETEGKRKNSAIRTDIRSKAASRKKATERLLPPPNRSEHRPNPAHRTPIPEPRSGIRFFSPAILGKTLFCDRIAAVFLKRHAYFFSGIHCNESPYKMPPFY